MADREHVDGDAPRWRRSLAALLAVLISAFGVVWTNSVIQIVGDYGTVDERGVVIQAVLGFAGVGLLLLGVASGCVYAARGVSRWGRRARRAWLLMLPLLLAWAFLAFAISIR